MDSTRREENVRSDNRFLVVSYSHKGNIEFIVIRDSWKAEEIGGMDEDLDSDGESETEYFLWPRNWEDLTTKELEKLYEQKEPSPDWRKYEILRCHKKKGKLVDAKNARNRAEDDFINKKKKLSEIGDTSDDSKKTLNTRKSRARKAIDDSFVREGKKAKTSINSLSSKIESSKSSLVFAKKSNPETLRNICNLEPRISLIQHINESPPIPSTPPPSLPNMTSSLLPLEHSPSVPLPALVHSASRIANYLPHDTSNPDILCTTPRSRGSSLNARPPRTLDAFLRALAEAKFQEGQPVDGVQFKFYMTRLFLGLKSLQSEVASSRNGTLGSGTSVQPPPPPLGPKPLEVQWPLNPQSFAQLEELLNDDYLLEEMTLWLSSTNNSLYSIKYGEMAKNILQKMFPVELQTSFVFSKGSYSKLEVRFECTRSCKMVKGALEKAHGSGKENLVKYRDAIQFWWDHKADNFKEYLRKKQNFQILQRFGDDTMEMRDRIKLFKDHHAQANNLDPKKFVYTVDKM